MSKKYDVSFGEAYIGQSGTHGVFVFLCFSGGYKVEMRDRATGDSSVKPHRYATFHSAVRAAKRLIGD